MWFTGRFSGAATVLVLDPSQVTGLPEEAGPFGVEVCLPVLESVAGLASEEPEVFEESAEELVPVLEGRAPGDGLVVDVVVAAPSSLAPVPLSHAVRQS